MRIPMLAIPLALSLAPSFALAQQVSLPAIPDPAAATTAPPVVASPEPRPITTAGPSLDAARLGINPAATQVPREAQSPDVSKTGKNTGRALAIVGGAALLVGALVGGTPGTVIMVSGGVVGLVGLFFWLR